ncbi:MAG: LamG domain-containing protein [Pseudobutyrivibrio sp.]|uniref:LamG domain-containing protein n=1 Tax=Pseudobutyrivibrio sp. TaxID=2014367 RepID=UPI0025CC34D7|nr:LamG domain-containing protein [Pseudobutyrivibrio sp.]MBQ8489784.1 LamG domain-containing protein [Pseudobutyrivibrio sp.]
MKNKKKFYGLIAGVTLLALATPFVGVSIVKADMFQGLVASYDFEDGIGDAKAIVKGMGAYNGEITYVDGINGKAVDFNDFGLDLGNKVNGTDFTITFSVCPDKSQADNQVMMLLGYHDKEHWLALSGDGADQEYKLWGRTDGVKTIGNAKPMSWTTVGNPTVPNGVWSQVALVGTDGNITMYVDGEKVVSGISNNPLGSENDSILFGANNWDACFDGKVDDIKIYNKAMSEGTVEEIAEAFKESRVQRSLELACSFDAIGGSNTEAGQIRYDLSLPTSLLGSNITWKSSDESVISNKGVVTIDDKKHDITLTADVKVDGVKGHVELKLVVDALDKAALNALIETAEGYDLSFMTEESADRLRSAIAEAKAATSFDEIDNATLHIESSIKALTPADEYEDPFDMIPESKVELTMKPGEEQVLFVLPDAIEKMVKVEYTSNDEAVSFEAGKAKAIAVGKAIVTARVTAVSDGFAMDYSTAVKVAKDETVTPAPSGGSSSGGSSSSGGGSSSSSGSGSSSSTGSGAAATTPVVAGNTGAQAQIPDAQVPAAGGNQSTKPKNDKVDTKTEDSDETIVEDEVVDEASDDVVDESEETVDDTTSETTISDEQTPEAGQSSGTSPVVVIIAALVIIGAAILAILAKLGILKL